MTRSNLYTATALVFSVLSVLITFVSAAAWWQKNETTEDAAAPTSEKSIPVPGIGWLDRIADSETAYTVDGTTYSSAYAAMMEGSPLDYPCRNFNSYLNSILWSPTFAASVADLLGLETAHYVLSYMRNFVFATTVYYVTALVFHYHCYVHPRAKRIFAERPMPTTEIMWDQVKLAQSSLFLYVVFTIVDEYMIEQGYTMVYYTLDEIGGVVPYVLLTLLYFTLVEIGIYWVHRTLHTNKFLYKHIHMLHHKYQKPETMSPWASIAFHPLDGIAQASPYVWLLPVVPCHYMTHIAMLFFTAIWATFIHDGLDFNVDPVMGSKYHTVHHTHYIYNYGQIFTFCDRYWGTFKPPDGPTGVAIKGPRKLVKTSRMKSQ